MFEPLEKIDLDVLNKMSNEDLYNFSLSETGNDRPLFKKYLNSSEFWAMLCQSRYGIDIGNATPKKEFQNAYLKEMLDVFPERYSNVKSLIEDEKLDDALAQSKKLIRIYGVAGLLVCLEVYQAGIATERSQDYARDGVTELETFERDYKGELSSDYFLTELDWRDKVITKDDTFENFIRRGIEFFKEYTSAQRCGM